MARQTVDACWTVANIRLERSSGTGKTHQQSPGIEFNSIMTAAIACGEAVVRYWLLIVLFFARI